MACSCTTELAVHLVGRLNISTESPISRCSESALRLLVENEGAKRPFCGGPLSIEPMINRIVAGAILATWSTIKARAIWSDRRLWVSYQRLWLKLPSADRGDDGYLRASRMAPSSRRIPGLWARPGSRKDLSRKGKWKGDRGRVTLTSRCMWGKVHARGRRPEGPGRRTRARPPASTERGA
jgi:hypothetical protein